MSTESIFTPTNDPVDVDLKNIGNHGVTTLFGGGIVNPFGPTLCAVVLQGEMEPGSNVPILHLSLNPFSQSAKKVGSAKIGETWNPVRDLAGLFNLQLGSCPTLLLPGMHLEDDDATVLFSHILATFSDGCEVLESVRAFPGDPWRRVAEEVNGMGSLLKSISTDNAENGDNRPLSKSESIELSCSLLKPENRKAELEAFLVAWKGSVEFQDGGVMGHSAMPMKAFIEWFALLAASCNLPEM